MNRSLGKTTSSPNWFAYAGARASEHLVPYLMHEEVKLADNDPYFLGDRFRRETVGARYEQAAGLVYKLELRSLDRHLFPRATELGVQLALAF